MQSTLSMMIHTAWRYGRIVCVACLFTLGLVSIVAAQQPTATIVQMSGEVLASFQGGTSAPGSLGLTLFQGDAIQTKAGAFAVIELSDGSQLELGENTNILMEQLAIEPYSEARVSRVKLWWGKMRAVLSPGHQKEGASFDIQTPNSLVGVKFSKPDLEVEFDLPTNTTRVYAYTVDVVVLNLLSGASQLVAAGSGVTVFGNGIQLLPQIPQAASAPQSSPVPPSSQPPAPPVAGSAGSAGSGGFWSGNLGTIAVTGLGAAAVVGGVIALNATQENKQSSGTADFSGTFHFNDSLEPGVDRTVALQLSQNDRTISGVRTETVVASGCCTAIGTGDVNGTVQGNRAILNVVRGAGECYCTGTNIIGVYWDQEFGRGSATLEQNGSTLNYNGQTYIRQ